MRKASLTSFFVVSGSAALVACSEPLPLQEDLGPQHVIGDVQPDKWACYDPKDPHCLPTPPDPSPTAPGIFLAFSPFDCQDELGTDSDQDGVIDICEYQLAYNFAPMMRSQSTDDTRGEAYWAVKTDGTQYQVFYALGYYADWGTEGSACTGATELSTITFLQWFGVEKQNYCAGHEGDSEFAVADVAYNWDTQHWELQRMYLSAHYQTNANHSAWYSALAFQYPERESWYPKVYVARGKHANYPSVSECQETDHALGIFPYQRDNCSYTTPVEARVEVLATRNLGSRAYPLQDNPIGSQGNSGTCRVSEEAYAGNNLQECFWTTGVGFGGWQPYNRVLGYGEILQQRGF